MNKLEAIQAMREGQKLTHDYFSPEEWVTMKDGKILLEDGVVCDTDEFWRWRKADNWNEGWHLFYENNKQSFIPSIIKSVCEPHDWQPVFVTDGGYFQCTKYKAV